MFVGMCVCVYVRGQGCEVQTHTHIHSHTYILPSHGHELMLGCYCTGQRISNTLYCLKHTHRHTHVRPRTHMRTHQHVEYVTFHMLHISNTLKWRKKWWNAIPTTFVHWSYKKERKTTKRTEPTKRTGCVCVRLPFCTTERRTSVHPYVRRNIHWTSRDDVVWGWDSGYGAQVMGAGVRHRVCYYHNGRRPRRMWRCLYI